MNNESTKPELEDEDEEILSLADIKDELVTVERTKSGVVTITRRGVFKLCQKGASIKDVAGIFGVSEITLKRHFEKEIFCAKANISKTLKAHLLREALREKPNAAIFLTALRVWAGITEDTNGEDETVKTAAKWNVEVKVVEKPKGLTNSEKAELEGDDE